eukprot:4538098-Pyramimonas_sp.AAC.1
MWWRAMLLRQCPASRRPVDPHKRPRPDDDEHAPCEHPGERPQVGAPVDGRARCPDMFLEPGSAAHVAAERGCLQEC